MSAKPIFGLERAMSPARSSAAHLIAAVTEQPILVEVRGLVLDERIQPREKMDLGKIAEYAELLRAAMVEGQDPAQVFRDPLVVYEDGDGIRRVASGFHRTSAARDAAAPQLLAILRKGDIAAARLWAAGTNHDHGLPRTAADRRRVLLWFLEDPSGKVVLTTEILARLPEPVRDRLPMGKPVALSDHLIAALCRVSQTTVSRLHAELRVARVGTPTETAHQLAPDEPEKRIGADGRSRRLPRPRVPEAPAEEADPAPARPATPARSAGAGPFFGWGRAWGERRPFRQKPTLCADDGLLRRSLAAEYAGHLDAVVWATRRAGLDPTEARDAALHALVAGAKRGLAGRREARDGQGGRTRSPGCGPGQERTPGRCGSG